MGIQEVQGQSGTPAYQKKKETARGEGFQESLLQNLKYRDREKRTAADTQTEEKRNKVAAQPKQGILDAQTDARTKAGKAGMGRLGAAPGIHLNAVAAQNALQAVEVRHMSYEESDHVKIAVTEGYTLKGKLLRNTDMAGGEAPNAANGPGKEESGTADAAQVYVEAKYEDGRLEAYQVDTAKVSAGTEHVIERFALETAAEA